MKKSVLAGLSIACAAFMGMQVLNVSPSLAVEKICDGPKITWKYSLWGKRRAVTEGSEFVSKAIKQATCGRFDIRLYYGEQLSKAKENLDALKVGAVDAAFVCSAYHPGKVPAMSVLDLPFLPISDFETMRLVYDTMWEQDALKKSLAKWSARRYLQNLLPVYEYMGRGKPPKGVTDFKGKRLRALGGMGAAARAIGAIPTSMTASETYTALQRGTVDAISFPFTYAFSAYKLDEISDWYTTNLSAGTGNCIMALQEGSWEKLPSAYRRIMEDVKDGAYKAMIEAYDEIDKVNLAKWRKSKMVAVQFSEDDLAEFRRVGGTPVWDAWLEKHKDTVPNGQELIDLLIKTAKGGR